MRAALGVIGVFIGCLASLGASEPGNTALTAKDGTILWTSPFVNIVTPGSGGTVGTSFTTTGTAGPTPCTVKAELWQGSTLVATGNPGSLLTSNGNWSFNFTGVAPGSYTTKANPTATSASILITVA